MKLNINEILKYLQVTCLAVYKLVVNIAFFFVVQIKLLTTKFLNPFAVLVQT